MMKLWKFNSQSLLFQDKNLIIVPRFIWPVWCSSLSFNWPCQTKSGHEFALPPHHASPVTIKGDSRVSREFSTTVFTSSEWNSGRRTIYAFYWGITKATLNVLFKGIGIYNLRDTRITTENLLTEVLGAKQGRAYNFECGRIGGITVWQFLFSLTWK